MRFLPSATFGATGSSRMLRVLTEFSEENSSPERNEMLVVSLRRSLIREPQPPELDGGSLAPAWKGRGARANGVSTDREGSPGTPVAGELA